EAMRRAHEITEVELLGDALDPDGKIAAPGRGVHRPLSRLGSAGAHPATAGFAVAASSGTGAVDGFASPAGGDGLTVLVAAFAAARAGAAASMRTSTSATSARMD